MTKVITLCLSAGKSLGAFTLVTRLLLWNTVIKTLAI